jgi:hypothetical protein
MTDAKAIARGLPKRRLWVAGAVKVELDMDWHGAPVVVLDGFSVIVRRGEIDDLVAALLDAAEQIDAAALREPEA